MTLPHRPVAVIFDMDGLLFDTEALWQDALLAAAAEAGHEIPDELYNGSIGVRRSQCGDLFRSHFGENFAFAAFHADWRRHFWRIAETGLALKPGVVELLERLDSLRLPRAIATSSSWGHRRAPPGRARPDRSLRPDRLPRRLRTGQARARSLPEGRRAPGG